jgi:glucosamine--fructose-6-phosphate aminotransferase (isomerizing)
VTSLPDRGPRTPDATAIYREAAQGPGVVSAQLERNAAAVERLARELRAHPPRAVVTCARGSSDHAATYAKYLVEVRLGILTASAAPSVASLYASGEAMRDCLFVALSQSGRSPDLLETTRAAKRAGARVAVLVNDEKSPLARLADDVLALCAGTERSIAATKSHIATLFGLLHLVSAWSDDRELREAVSRAADTLERAWQLDWSAALPLLTPASHLFVIARGIGLGLAQEAALKCKETCALHAEAFSAAEVRHGPQALLGRDFPALLFAQDDEARAGIEELGAELAARGVPLAVAGARVPGAVELAAEPSHPALAPIALVQSFYRFATSLALARGQDPDNPPHLSKVTETR